MFPNNAAVTDAVNENGRAARMYVPIVAIVLCIYFSHGLMEGSLGGD